MADKDIPAGAIPDVPPGTLAAVEVSYKPALDFTEQEKQALKKLVTKLAERDLPAWREEIIRVWEKRLFDRGCQHLIPEMRGDRQIGWQLPGAGTGYGQGDQEQRSIFETNIYNAYSQIVISALTREVPGVRFEPDNPDSDVDITAADTADKLREYVQRNNRMKAVMAEMVRFLWTDGRALMEANYIKDGSRFGYEDPEEQALEEETVPETEEKISEEEENAGMEEQEAESVGSGGQESGEGDQQQEPSEDSGEEARGEPRGREVISVHGALEAKLPMKADCLAECDYVQVSREINIARARAKYPDVAESIQVESGGPGGDDIDRLARINVRLGVFSQILTADSQVYDVTEQRTWLRPSQLLEIDDIGIRASLLKKAGKDGLRVIFCGQTFCEGRSLSMDEQLTLLHAKPGDGMHRPGLGDWLVPIQKVFNNWMELSDDYFIHGVPNIHADNEMFDFEKMRDQVNMVGAWHPLLAPPGDGTTLEQHVFVEPTAQFPTPLWDFIQWFQEGLSQLLCGAFPALSGGGDSAPTDTYGGMLVQRDQALGIIGIPWRSIKEAMPNVFKQAIMCLANNRDDSIRLKQDQESVIIEMKDMRGNFLAFPESDEGFPESHTQIQNRMTQLWTDAASNQNIAEFVYNPDNLEVFLRTFNVKGFYLPQVAARDKQLGEIVELLGSGPVPNPKLIAAQKQLQALQQKGLAAAQAGGQPDPQDVQAATVLQAAIAKLAPQVSSVDVKPWNDHETEIATCLKILNSPRARTMSNGTEDEQAGIQNLELHLAEHEQALQAKQSQQQQTPKPVTRSIAIKDLPPAEAAQLAQQAGLQASPSDFKAEEVADTVSKHPGSITVQ